MKPNSPSTFTAQCPEHLAERGFSCLSQAVAQLSCTWAGLPSCSWRCGALRMESSGDPSLDKQLIHPETRRASYPQPAQASLSSTPGACAGAGGRASSAPGTPDQPRAPCWSSILVSSNIPEQLVHLPSQCYSSSTAKHENQAARVPQPGGERNTKTCQQDNSKPNQSPRKVSSLEMDP